MSCLTVGAPPRPVPQREPSARCVCKGCRGCSALRPAVQSFSDGRREFTRLLLGSNLSYACRGGQQAFLSGCFVGGRRTDLISSLRPPRQVRKGVRALHIHVSH